MSWDMSRLSWTGDEGRGGEDGGGEDDGIVDEAELIDETSNLRFWRTELILPIVFSNSAHCRGVIFPFLFPGWSIPAFFLKGLAKAFRRSVSFSPGSTPRTIETLEWLIRQSIY